MRIFLDRDCQWRRNRCSRVNPSILVSIQNRNENQKQAIRPFPKIKRNSAIRAERNLQKPHFNPFGVESSIQRRATLGISAVRSKVATCYESREGYSTQPHTQKWWRYYLETSLIVERVVSLSFLCLFSQRRFKVYIFFFFRVTLVTVRKSNLKMRPTYVN